MIADLSTSNKNAFYELGVRHALRPHTTIVICEDGAKSFPFDVNHVLVRQYHHMGDGIDFEEVERFRATLTGAIREILNRNPPTNDSPVYTFLNGLTPPALAAALQGVAGAVANVSQQADASGRDGDDPYGSFMEEVDAAQNESDFETAKVLLTRLRKRMRDAAQRAAEEARANGQPEPKERPEDPYVIQRLALVTYKSKSPSVAASLADARTILSTLDPATSNDTETLGLWGAVHKRLWETTREAAYLDDAIRAYERGFYLRHDYYNGINVAFLQNVRASEFMSHSRNAPTPEERVRLRAEAVACFVTAARIRREVLSICEQCLNESRLSADERYWILATMAEADLGLGNELLAEQRFAEASKAASAPWMTESTRQQMTTLRGHLADSPLSVIRVE